MAQPLLSGQVGRVIDPLESELSRLEDENRELREQVRNLDLELSHTKRENQRAIAELRRMTTPFLNALLAVHGQMDAIGVEPNAPNAPPANDRVRQLWEEWKRKLPGNQANFIDALLTHGELSAAQLRVCMKCANQTVYDTAVKLNRLGLLGNAGKGRYKLKEL